MKTAFFVLIGAGALLILAGQSASAGDRHINVVITHPRPNDPDADTSVQWTMREKGNGKGALHLKLGSTNDVIVWHFPGPFSIVVTNRGEWTDSQGLNVPWRNDVCCPFNDSNMGVIDSTNSGSDMVVSLKPVHRQAAQKTVGYAMTVPTVCSAARPFSRMVPYDFSMVDATMDWTGTFFGKGGKGPEPGTH